MARALKLVMIEWLDAHAGRGWQTVAQIKTANEPLLCRSVGWLISETKDCKTLVPHVAGDRKEKTLLLGSGDLTIPSKSILRMTVLRTP